MRSGVFVRCVSGVAAGFGISALAMGAGLEIVHDKINDVSTIKIVDRGGSSLAEAHWKGALPSGYAEGGFYLPAVVLARLRDQVETRRDPESPEALAWLRSVLGDGADAGAESLASDSLVLVQSTPVYHWCGKAMVKGECPSDCTTTNSVTECGGCCCSGTNAPTLVPQKTVHLP